MIGDCFLKRVGNTPMIKIKDFECVNEIDLYIKYEGGNPTGSLKDRAANYLLDKLIEKNEINEDTTILESSSGNFGISLSAYCKKKKLTSRIVIDPNILLTNEMYIRALASDVVKVTERDKSGGYLLTRIAYIKQFMIDNPNTYWVNQYSNPYICEAYKNTLGKEITSEVQADYIFIGVSSGGTITGVSNAAKEASTNTKIIAVDSVGSVIFDQPPKKRYIPGIGSSMKPESIVNAYIDDVVFVDEANAIKECHKFAKNEGMLIGGSSGSVIAAIKSYFTNINLDYIPKVIALFPDNGSRYVNTIYNNKWVKENYNILCEVNI